MAAHQADFVVDEKTEFGHLLLVAAVETALLGVGEILVLFLVVEGGAGTYLEIVMTE